jgi:hypothetical protein
MTRIYAVDHYKAKDIPQDQESAIRKDERKTVWVVAESRFEWYEVKHICVSKEVALQRWVELRDELVKGNQEMVEYCIREGFTDGKDWQKNIELLKELKPGDSCQCDYPDLKEWELESQQIKREKD